MKPELKIYPEAKGLIFDLDGTLADTMPTHFKAWTKTGEKFGFEFPEEKFYQFAGMSLKRILSTLSQEQGLAIDIEKARQYKYEAYLELVENIAPVEPVFSLAKSYVGKLPMTIGTGNVMVVATKTVADLDMSDWFQAIVTPAEVDRPKPYPDTFLKCAEIMGIDPQYCQVFEDGEPGIQAAEAAGMMVSDIRKYRTN